MILYLEHQGLGHYITPSLKKILKKQESPQVF